MEGRRLLMLGRIALTLLCAQVAVSLITDYKGPTFLHEPPNKVMFYNNTGTVISCSSTGNPRPLIRWIGADGNPIMDIPSLRHVRADGSLVLSQFRAKDYRQDVHSTTYRCSSSNAVGSVISKAVHVRGVIFQHFEARVYDEFVIRGNVGVLRCTVPSYVRDYVKIASWRRDDGLTILPQRTFGSDSKYIVFPTGELHVRNVGHTDSHATYRCLVKNTLTGNTKESATGGRLIVTDPQAKVPPRITHTARGVIASQGDTVLLPCAAQGHPAPSYKWTKRNSGQLLYLSTAERRHQFEGALVIHQASVQDSGLYVCTAASDVGDTRLEVQLTVRAALHVTIQPDRQEVSTGMPVTVNCTITGHPVTSVEWLKDQHPLVFNRRISLMNRGTVLHIVTVQREDRGMYQCFAQNDDEASQSGFQLSIASEPPVLVSKFQELVTNSGESITLKCAAVGNPLPQITWFTYGMNVQDNNRVRVGDYVSRDGSVISFINISKVEVTDGGQYQCRATNDYGMDEHASNVHVTGAPVIRSMPNRTVVAGQHVIVHCPVSGYPITTIRWERGNRQLPLGRRQKVFANGTLMIMSVDGTEDESRYTCEVQGAEGTRASRDMYMKVLVPPSITPFSFPKNPQEGMRASVTCSVPVGDPPIRISWLKDGRPLSLESGISSEMIDDFVSTLVFKSLRQDHSGSYTCRAVNDAATVNFSIPLSVNAPPRWRVEPTDKSAPVGGSVVLDCLATGRPEPRVIWKKEADESSMEYRTIISGSHIQSLVNGSLVIREIEQEDDGRYMCEASNGVGSPLSTVVRLTVHVPAHFTQKFVAETVRKGEAITIRCEAFGEKPVSFLWLKDRQPLTGLSRPRYMLREQVMSASHVSELIIHVVERSDTGLYTCLASNAYGQDERNIQLTVKEPPDPPLNVEVAQTGGRSVLIRWSVPFPGNSPILKHIIQYKLASDLWEAKGKEISVDGEQSQFNIQDLQPLTKYNIRVIAENAIGKGGPSDIVTVLTDGEVPGGPPRTIQANAKASRTINVFWEPPLQSLHHGSIRGYYVGYKAHGSAEPYVYKTVEAREGLERRCEISGLKQATKYGVVVQAFNDKGAGPLSDEVVVQTMEFDPPKSPILKVMSTTSSTVFVMWESALDSDAVVTGYIMHWRENGAAWIELQLPAEKKSHKFTGLLCGTRYQFYITAFNALGRGDPSDIVSAKTEGSNPVAPKEDSFIIRNSTTICLKLSAWQDGGCTISYFDIRYKQQRQQDWRSISSKVEPPEDMVYIADLSPGMWFNVLVSARNTVGVTEMEYIVSTLTLYGGTVQPETLGEKEQLRKYKSLSIIVPIGCAVVVLVAVSVAVFLLVCKKRSTRMSNLYEGVRPNEDPKGDSMVMADLEKTYEQSRESVYFPAPYATTRVPVLQREDGGLDRESCRSLTHPGVRGSDHLYDIPQPLRDDIKRQYHRPSGLDGRASVTDYEGLENYQHLQSIREEIIQETLDSYLTSNNKGLRTKHWLASTPSQKWRGGPEETTYSPIHVPTHSVMTDVSELSDAECDRDFSHMVDSALKVKSAFQVNIQYPCMPN